MITIAETRIRAHALRIARFLELGDFDSAELEYNKLLNLPFDLHYARICLQAIPEGRAVLAWRANVKP